MLDSIPAIISDLTSRIERVEQTRHGNWVTVGGTDVPVFPGGFAVGPDDEFVFTDVDAPTNVTATSDTFFDVSYILVDWDAPIDSDPIAGYRVELYKVGFGVARTIQTGGTNARFEPIEPNTDYTITVSSINKLGKPSVAVTALPNPIRSAADSTIPAAPTGVVASSNTTARAIQVRWSENTEQDVRGGAGLYEWEVSTANTVDPITGDFTVSPRRDRTAATIIYAVDLVGGTNYYAHVRAIDSSNNFSPWSSIVTASPGLLSDLDVGTLNGSHINVGTLHGNRLQANSADIGVLTTSELNAAIITITNPTGIGAGGMIRMGRINTPFHYLVEDSNGIRFYKNGTSAFTAGTLVMDLNVATGDAFFGGSLAAGVSITSPLVSGGTFTAINLTTQNATFGGQASVVWATNGTWAIEGNEAKNTNADTNATYLGVVDSGRADGLWSLKFRTSPTTNRTWLGIVFRYIDNSNYWLAEVRKVAGTSAVLLWKNVGGVFTAKGSWNVTINSSTEYTLRAYTVGSEIYLYLDDVFYVNTTDASHSTATKGGIYIARGPSNDDGGSRFIQFTTSNLSDNFTRPNAATLGSTTTLSKIAVDGTGLVALSPSGAEQFRMYAASGEFDSKGYFASSFIHARVGMITTVNLKQISSQNANADIIVAGHLSMHQNTIYLNQISSPGSYLRHDGPINGPILTGVDRFRISATIGDAGLEGSSAKIHVMNSTFNAYRGIIADGFQMAAKPTITGSGGGNAGLYNLLNALHAIGLIINNVT